MKKDELSMLRKRVDEIDDQLVLLLAKRVKVVTKIKKFKRKKKLAIVDKKREQEVLKKARKKAKKLGLSEDCVEKLLKLVMKKAKLIQRQK